MQEIITMDQTRKNEIIAVALFAVSLFLFLSIFTFREQDLSFYTSTPNTVAQNGTGVVGSFLGGTLLFFMGKASYVIPFLIMVWGISRLLQIEERRVFFKVFGTVVLIAAASASLSMLAGTSRAMAFGQGGLIGALVSEFLLEYLGGVGAGVFIVATIILSMLVATEFLILPILITVWKFFSRMISEMKDSIPSRSNTPAEPRKYFSKPQTPAPAKSPAPATSARQAERVRINSAKEEVAKKLEAMKKQVEQVRRSPLALKPPVKAEARPEGKTLTPAGNPKIVTAAVSEKVAQKPARVAPVASGPAGQKVDYKLPGLDLLRASSKEVVKEQEEDLKLKAAMLEKTLLDFEVEAKVVKINKGPVITMYELEPSVGTKVNKITSLTDNISLAMRSSNIRIIAPLPGKGTIGIEVPNEKSELVLLRDILETKEYHDEKSPLKLALGKDLTGETMVTDLTKMPHLLIAGTTGSGKTVCINCIIASILFNASPEEIKFLMIDPKRVELMMFEGIPHLCSPIVTNAKKAAAALAWAVNEMDRRYDVFASHGVRNIAAYKDKVKDGENIPYIVVIVDELADLMIVAQQDIEGLIMRLAQLSRAAGIHMILATQRPSVNVITGVIKANFPARISFKVASKVDSRTVLDANGAEKLLGRGDMLFMEPGEMNLVRGQCALVEDSELKELVRVIKVQAEPKYSEDLLAKQETKVQGGVDQEKDDLYREAVKIVIQTRQASVSMIQRKLRVGYTRAARMIDIMETEGIVGPYNGAKPRDILVDDVGALQDKQA